MSAFTTDGIRAWREGSVTNDIATHLYCCVPRHDTEEVLHYIEVMYEDGGRLFLYEDENGYERFSDDFDKRRFTAFHEFWTTEETGEEDRGGISLKYYIRRPEEDHLLTSLQDARAALAPFPQLADRMTTFHRYDRRVDYHLQTQA